MIIAHTIETDESGDQRGWVSGHPRFVSEASLGVAVLFSPRGVQTYVNGFPVIRFSVLLPGDLVRWRDDTAAGFFRFGGTYGSTRRDHSATVCGLTGDVVETCLTCLACGVDLAEDLFRGAERCPVCSAPWTDHGLPEPPEELL